jgi:hypothetical protein
MEYDINMQRTIKCEECDKQIKTWRKDHKFCSVNCRVKNWQHKKMEYPEQLDLFGDKNGQVKDKN